MVDDEVDDHNVRAARAYDDDACAWADILIQLLVEKHRRPFGL